MALSDTGGWGPKSWPQCLSASMPPEPSPHGAAWEGPSPWIETPPPRPLRRPGEGCTHLVRGDGLEGEWQSQACP